MKVVIDTNILLVSISRYSTAHWIYESLLEGKFSLCVTSHILNEYEEIIAREIDDEAALNVLQSLENLPNVEFITKYFRWNLISKDYDDNKFSDCAIAANVDYLVTNDKHFNILKKIPFPKVNVIIYIEFKEILIK